MTAQEDRLYSLYIGTTKIVGMRGHKERDGNRVVDTLVKVSSHGFERGVVVDIEKACAQVKDVVQKLVPEAELPNVAFHVIIANNLIKVFPGTSSIYFGDVSRTINQFDIDRVVSQARSTATIPLSENIILAEPQEFMINDIAGIKSPLELDARRLAVDLLLYTAGNDVVKNLTRVFERLELSIAGFYPRTVTAAHSVLRPEEKRDGVVLIDISGNATAISYYNNHNMGFYEIVPFGGEMISSHLAQHLNISLIEARRLKEQYGSATVLERFEDEIIPVVDIFGKTKFNITKKRLYDQVHIAAKELADKIYAVLRQKREKGLQLCGAVVTGGGAKLDGFLDLIQKQCGISVRLGIARNVSGHNDAVSNAAYASQLGLLGYVQDVAYDKERQYAGKNIIAKQVLKVKTWIRENF